MVPSSLTVIAQRKAKCQIKSIIPCTPSLPPPPQKKKTSRPQKKKTLFYRCDRPNFSKLGFFFFLSLLKSCKISRFWPNSILFLFCGITFTDSATLSCWQQFRHFSWMVGRLKSLRLSHELHNRSEVKPFCKHTSVASFSIWAKDFPI